MGQVPRNWFACWSLQEMKQYRRVYRNNFVMPSRTPGHITD
jgi:hypothetical protein